MTEYDIAIAEAAIERARRAAERLKRVDPNHELLGLMGGTARDQEWYRGTLPSEVAEYRSAERTRRFWGKDTPPTQVSPQELATEVYTRLAEELERIADSKYAAAPFSF